MTGCVCAIEGSVFPPIRTKPASCPVLNLAIIFEASLCISFMSIAGLEPAVIDLSEWADGCWS
ncbi:hypothetical protein PG993_013813 [Apiospora rasikravindrae]|uniref:Uncharacterized protein n=1 Tax=Apiospora rasikravindrae TaxID=990691 RepID=A0ABR1RRK5_9PEZI